eukprot:20084-Chlamydomonas_euryale.AAC.1
MWEDVCWGEGHAAAGEGGALGHADVKPLPMRAPTLWPARRVWRDGEVAAWTQRTAARVWRDGE